MVKEFAVQLTADGMLPIPESLSRALGLKPLQTVYLRSDDEQRQLVIQLATRKEIGDRIVELMREAFEGVTWADIEAGRADDRNAGNLARLNTCRDDQTR